MSHSSRPTGLTRDYGWQIGVRRTLLMSRSKLWDLLVSPAGVDLWLGPGEERQIREGAAYRLSDGTWGEVRVFKPYSHLRITRQPPNPEYHRPSTLQVRVLDSGLKSVLAFHEEHLPSQEQRQARKTFFLGVIDAIQELGIT